MSLKLVAIDLDNTLLREDKTYEQGQFNQIVQSLTDRGVIVVIASGNDVRKIKHYMSEDILDKIYVAGDNANDIEFDGEHIYTNFFSFDALHQIEKLVDGDEDLQMVLNTQKTTYSKYIYEEDQDHVDVYYDKVTIVESYKDIPEGEEPVKCAILSRKSLVETKEVLREIEEGIEGVTAVTSGDGWLDAYSEAGGKGSAVEWVQSENDISPDETIAFGDSLNDSSMMEFAKYSVAMENADEEFRDYCNYVIGTNEDQAVLEVLEQYLDDGNMDFMEKYKK